MIRFLKKHYGFFIVYLCLDSYWYYRVLWGASGNLFWSFWGHLRLSTKHLGNFPVLSAIFRILSCSAIVAMWIALRNRNGWKWIHKILIVLLTLVDGFLVLVSLIAYETTR